MDKHETTEIVSLNFQDLDVAELERRLELAVTQGGASTLGWCIGDCDVCGKCEDCAGTYTCSELCYDAPGCPGDCYSLCPGDSGCPGDHTM